MRAKGESRQSVTRHSKENLNKAVMNDTNSDVNSGVGSEEPEFVWALLCHATTHERVRKTDTNWTDRDSEHLECFSCVVVRCGDVECAEQDVVSLSEIQSESYLDRDRIKGCTIKMRLLIVGAWAGEDLPVVSGTGLTIGEDLLKGHSWTTGGVLLITVGVGLLGCGCAVSDPHLPTGNLRQENQKWHDSQEA